jgi:ribosomal protein L11 methyltransferase
MNHPLGQSHIIYQITFYSNYEDLALYETFFSVNEELTSTSDSHLQFSLIDAILGISSHEVISDTIESLQHDVWQMDILSSQAIALKALHAELTQYSIRHNIKFIGLKIRPVEQQDWVAAYQAAAKPLLIERFIITAQDSNYELIENKIPIYIEASRAFGTGDHATTSLCIKAMAQLENINIHKIFDIGTGSGILSFAAEKIWPDAQILACDIDEVSVKIANENKIVNNSAVTFYQNTEEDLCIPLKWQRNFDLIISNILAIPLIHLAQNVRNLSKNKSYIILSGFLDYQAKEVIEAYQAQGFEVYNKLQEDKWMCVVLFLVE